MNTAVLAKSLYAKPTREVGTQRGIEYKAFSKATARLVACTSDQVSFSELAEALCENQLLWSVLGADVADSRNQLSSQIRAQIFYLAEFTNLHTRQVLDGTASVDALVEINTSIMRGLRNSAPPIPAATSTNPPRPGMVRS